MPGTSRGAWQPVRIDPDTNPSQQWLAGNVVISIYRTAKGSREQESPLQGGLGVNPN